MILESLWNAIVKVEREAWGDRGGCSRRIEHPGVVRVFLRKKDVEAALREAQEGGRSDAPWLKLAARRENPDDDLRLNSSMVLNGHAKQSTQGRVLGSFFEAQC